MSLLSLLLISAYLTNILHFALFFASLDIFSLTVCMMYGFTGTCQICAKIDHKQVKLFIFTKCLHVFNNLTRGTLSPSV